MSSAIGSLFSPPGPRPPERSRRSRRVGGATLVAAVLASTALGTSPAAAVTTSAALRAGGPAPGTIFVANGGAGQNGTGPGSVTLYRPGVTGDARPETIITEGIDEPGGLTFDASGDLWVGQQVGNIFEYSRAELAKASPVPTVSLSYVGGGLAFDSSGNLWVANPSSEVVEFTKAEIARSGSPIPVRTLLDDCSVGSDAHGDVWEGSQFDTVAEFTNAQLAKAGPASPAVTITSTDLSGPCRPAFDRSGDLWAGNYNSNTVVEFTKAELAKSGSPAPKVVITSSKYNEPGDVAVSSSGDLWVPYFGGVPSFAVVEFTKAQLGKSGSPTPAVTIVGPDTGLNNPWAVAIEP